MLGLELFFSVFCCIAANQLCHRNSSIPSRILGILVTAVLPQQAASHSKSGSRCLCLCLRVRVHEMSSRRSQRSTGGRSRAAVLDVLAARCPRVFTPVAVSADIDMHSAQPIEREADPLPPSHCCMRVSVCAYLLGCQAILSVYQRDVWGQTH